MPQERRSKSAQSQLLCLELEELDPILRKLSEEAKRARAGSHAPYSHFPVGAAVLLEDERIIAGNNQENAAFPSGLCAERTALFYASANFGHLTIKALAISVNPRASHFPIPCGSCLQVMAEMEEKQGEPFDIYLLEPQAENVWHAAGVQQFLPFTFSAAHLRK